MGRALLPVALAVAASACAYGEARRVGEHRPGDPSWPRGESRQIAWVGEIRGPESLGIERGFFARVWDFITGADEEDFLYRPYGVAVDGTGRVAVADPGRRTVHLLDPVAGKARRLRGADGARLVYPVAVAFVGRTLLVADPEAAAVRAYGEDGKPAALPAALPRLVRPVALAADEVRHRLFVVDTAEHVVHVLPLVPGGAARTLGGRGGAPGLFNFPTHIAVNGEGQLAVCDAMNFRIQIFDAELRPIHAFGQNGDGLGDLSRPKGLAVDREGVVFVLEGYFDVIQAFEPGGRLLGIFGGSGVQPGRFWLAGGMALDARGRLWVADTFNARVQVFDLEAKTP
jgi:sugar lactone lactonase YvrE